MEKVKYTAGIMEIAVVDLLDWRKHVIVPNVSWGLDLRHEADLLAMDRSMRTTEIEIKVSLSDLRADFRKRHGHISKHIGRLVYAVPEPLLARAKEIVPEEHGLIAVNWTGASLPSARWVRIARYGKHKEPLDTKVAMRLMRLGCMRVWTLKRREFRKSLNHL